MSNLQEAPTYHEGIYQLETTDKAKGGPEGLANRQAKQLADRTAWLKEELAKNDLPGHLAAAHPHEQYILRSEAGGSFVAPDNAVAKSGDTMTGLLTLSGFPVLDMQAVPKLYIDNLIPKAVRRPTNTTPANNATSFATTGTLVATAFYSLYGLTHAASQFQVSTAPDFATVTYDSGETTAVTSKAISPALAAGTTYFWRVRYKDSAGDWSDWSIPTRFSTGTSLVAVPSVTAPTSGATGQSRTPTLTSSAFAMQSGSDTHASSRWQIATDANFANVVVDSGISTTAKTSYTLATNLAYGVTYYARCLYIGASYGSSGWSATISFTTLAGSSGVPEVSWPVNGSTGQSRTPNLQSTPFSSVGAADTHQSSQWQVATDVGFGNIVVDSGTSTTAKISYQVATNLNYGQTYYARVRHTGANYGTSSWSTPISFTVVAGAVLTPTITSPTNGATGVLNTPTFTATPFACDGATDTHAASDWEIRTAAGGAGTLILSSANDTNNKTSITLPDGFLQINTTYYLRARYKGTAYGYGGWAEASFTTAESFVPTVPGTPYKGGYYAGRINDNGTEFALIASPKASGQALKQWKLTTSSTAGASSLTNGYANTYAMDNANHPAAAFCKGLTIGGYTDWYLPARDELEILYRNLKPTSENNDVGTRATQEQIGAVPGADGLANGYNSNSVPVGIGYTQGSPSLTLATAFQSGGTEAISGCWSSTGSGGSSGIAWHQAFSGSYAGRQATQSISSEFYVRAIRRVPVAGN